MGMLVFTPVIVILVMDLLSSAGSKKLVLLPQAVLRIAMFPGRSVFDPSAKVSIERVIVASDAVCSKRMRAESGLKLASVIPPLVVSWCMLPSASVNSQRFCLSAEGPLPMSRR